MEPPLHGQSTGSNAAYEVFIMSERDSFHLTGWSFFCGIVLATVAVAVVANLHDIKRYIRISTM